MSAEIDIYGVFVPMLLALMVVAFVVTGVLRFALARLGFYKLVWHRSLFNLAVYIIALGGIVAIARACQP
ncbi:DUF1656 domain-containing protein [Pandoraea nosoerga]|uniref:Membrane protein n=1 Tax=Pandoraea nosoerga TaxID=2508296 RepID=A0A5E4WC54_9BURK|nr:MULTISPECIES: DUF1656 domain-containing protein [Pandoraea]MBN4665932.1 DUF1656 domain-containing protein [Pandoraea nosoerga]MBN4676106.1 DUF1656 domain-containing protein [Pandoraea nosoerga]MBN4682485.1 DUF1656 domain-containing protein [Pandoraea nosoerga]MBN4745026.1 DUF1656 domain-containing protein [Pandoraea nosoerga]VVE22148.1 membrane protein [Pandoraea nosoerga]